MLRVPLQGLDLTVPAQLVWSFVVRTPFLSQRMDFCECSVIYPPVQKTVDKTRTIRDYVERPRQGSILEPLPYRCLRYRFVLRLLGDEALESIQDAQVNLR